MNKFEINQRVFISSLDSEGLIVEIRGSKKIRVAVGDLVIDCAPSEVAVVPARSRTNTQTEPSVRRLQNEAFRERNKLSSIDLHGLRVDEATAQILSTIDRAILAGVNEVRVVHGIGSGALRDALHKLLTSLKLVRSFKIDEANPGVTRVFL